MRAAPLADAPLSQGAVLTKAVLRASDRLGVTGATLAAVIGLSPASLTRMKKGEFALESGTKPFELAILFVRLFRSLDAIAGGDERIARAWLANPNTALDAAPIDKIRTIAGLMDVIAYLDARRAVV
ncbi:antitoxin Xre/MbcA/ParS toxin-binding domain-containing protein [Xanthobacter flavus]|uniref:antitoxin Xre/MbcA/ParS toxin-binding domain-containing protein n=1 Tax=Xanthobacter flavus TaxID=281 RepID=UPI00372659D2